MSACRSCGADVIWLRISPGGRQMPVDPVPVADGNVLVDLKAGAGVVLSAASLEVVRDETPEEPLYRSHFSTCPQASEWRKR